MLGTDATVIVNLRSLDDIYAKNTLKRIFHAKAAPNQFSHIFTIELLLSVEIKLVK